MARRKSIVINRADRFIADTHFGHSLMVSDRTADDGSVLPRFRAFDTLQEHDEHIISMWNSVVAKSDTVYHLGDAFFWRMPVDDMKRIFKRLNGRKHLLIGNHDTPEVETLGWEQVHRGPVHFKDAATGTKVIATHHPLREWDGWHNGAVHIHGHTHGNLPSSRRSLDVGIDSVGYLPLTAAEIFTHMAALPELDFRGVEVPDFNPSYDDAGSGYGR